IPRPVVARVATPPPLKQRPVKEVKKQEPVAQKPIAQLPAEALSGGKVNFQEILKQTRIAPEGPGVVEEDDESEGAKGKARPGGVAGRDKRRDQRNRRAAERRGHGADRGTLAKVLEGDDEDHPRRRGGSKGASILKLKKRLAPTMPRKGK